MNPGAGISQCVAYEELGREEIFAMLRLRQDVFIVEQNCIYLDIDHKDAHSHHFFLWRAQPCSSELMAYCRIVKPGVSYQEPSIGRVVSSASGRGAGWGRELMKRALLEMDGLYPGLGVRISAQAYLERFYRSFGFVTVSEPYMEDDIPHLEMLLKDAG